METNQFMSDLQIFYPVLIAIGIAVVVVLLACTMTKWLSNSVIKAMKQLEELSPTSPQFPCVITEKGKITASQKVKLFEDVDQLVIQSANINEDDPNWITVKHHTEEFTLSIENWKHLVSLVHSILPIEKGGVQ